MMPVIVHSTSKVGNKYIELPWGRECSFVLMHRSSFASALRHVGTPIGSKFDEVRATYSTMPL